jgi:hypothetical protein
MSSDDLNRREFVRCAARMACWSGIPTAAISVSEAAALPAAFVATARWIAVNVLTPMAVELFLDWLKTARVFPKEPEGDFHARCSDPVSFDREFAPSATRFVGFFGVNAVPTVLRTRLFQRCGELNLIEMIELQNDRNPHFYEAGRLRRFPLPTSERYPPTQWDIERFAYDLARNGIARHAVELAYARRFHEFSTGVAYRGFGYLTADDRAGFRIVLEQATGG